MKLLAALAVLTFCAAAIPARAQDPAQKKADAEQKAMRIVQSLQYQTGEITLLDGKAKIKLTDDFKFLDPANARKVLVDLWHNPPGAGSVTGMIVPKGFLVTDGWAAVLQWSDVGYVKDSEYDGIDFKKMLDQLKEKNVEESKNREAAGYGQMLLTGWATAPHYDKQSHKLYWAKSFDVKRSEQALNYDIRVLGRSGVMIGKVVGRHRVHRQAAPTALVADHELVVLRRARHRANCRDSGQGPTKMPHR